MVDIDYIMDMLDWNNSIDIQEQGIRLAQDVKCINVFLQPNSNTHSKNVWDNCAKILSMRTNEELSPYLIELMEWLQDMNWPGAFCILDILKKMVTDPLFRHSYSICLKYAKAMEDETWESNLTMIEKDI